MNCTNLNPTNGPAQESQLRARLSAWWPACWPLAGLLLLALAGASTGPGHRARTNAADWVNALTGAGHNPATNARDHTYSVESAPAYAIKAVAHSPNLVERDRQRAVQRVGDSERRLIALAVALLLAALAMLDRFDAIVEAASVRPDYALHTVANQHATHTRFPIQCLGAQNEVEIIARHDDWPATRGVAAVLQHSVN